MKTNRRKGRRVPETQIRLRQREMVDTVAGIDDNTNVALVFKNSF